MNRNSEYFELLEKLDSVKIPEKCVTRAVRRRRINSFITKPLASLAIIFLAFVLLVNVSPTVAMALENIPVIGSITRAVSFTTRSVQGAVENGYQQPLDMYSTDGDCAVTLRYLIADEKNVSFTFELTGDLPEMILPECTYGSGDAFVKLYCEGSKTHMTAATTYVDQEIKYPDSGTLTIELYELIVPDDVELIFTEDGGIVPSRSVEQPSEPFARFSFEITVDKSSIGEVKHFDVDGTLEVEGQKIRITGVDMYPTYTEITVEQDGANTAWIRDLEFNLKDNAKNVYLYKYTSRDAEMNVDPVMRKHPIRVYYTESMYFSEVKSIEFCLLSCAFIDKDAEAAEIDFKAGELTVPTDFIRVIEAEKNGDTVYAKFDVPIEAQLDTAALSEIGTITRSEEDYSENDPDPYRNTYEFRSDKYKSDKLKLDFIITGWFDSQRGRNVRLCTFDLPQK